MLNVNEINLLEGTEVIEKIYLNINEKEITRNNKFVNVGNIKPIKGFPDYYVSDEGKVYSTKSGKTREIKGGKEGSGYLLVTLCKDGKQYPKKVHRLVLSTFCPIPEMDKYQVNHRDENKENNKLDNLEWCTAKYNTNYGTRNERAGKAMKGRKNPWTSDFNKLTKSKQVLQYDTNYSLITSYSSATEAGEALGVHISTIAKYCRNLKLYKNKYYFQYGN